MPCAESLRQNGVTAIKAIPTYWVANRIYKCKFIYKAHYMKNVDALFEALSLLVGLICERSSVGQSVRLIIERSMVQIHPFAPLEVYWRPKLVYICIWPVGILKLRQ